MPYQPRVETIEIVVPETVAPVAAGHEPLTLTVRTTLSGQEFAALARPFRDASDAREAWAPLVIAWNLQDTPPPAEAGADQLRLLPFHVDRWLIGEISSRVGAALKARSEAMLATAAPVTSLAARPPDAPEPNC